MNYIKCVNCSTNIMCFAHNKIVVMISYKICGSKYYCNDCFIKRRQFEYFGNLSTNIITYKILPGLVTTCYNLKFVINALLI